MLLNYLILIFLAIGMICFVVGFVVGFKHKKYHIAWKILITSTVFLLVFDILSWYKRSLV
jgi:uncharacterized membrane protein YhfC